MIQEIKYNGFTANPSDYECNDGDLAGMINLVPDNGTIRPILKPVEILKLDEGCKVVFIHKTTNFVHYIVMKTNKSGVTLYWMNESDKSLSEDNKIGDLGYTPTSVNAVGNTLMVFNDKGIYYFLWKSGEYISLGDHIPNIEISFGLRGKPRLFSQCDDSKSTFKITFDGIKESDLYEVWTDTNQSKITSQIMAKVNKFLADQTINSGRFALPFFVRYALRLYDGSLIGHSAPILMNPSTKAAPVVFWKRVKGKNSYTEAELDIMLVSANIDYRLVADDYYEYSRLDDWSDIIKSVDVFISKPVYTYDQNGNCKSFHDTDNLDTKFIGTLDIDKFVLEPTKDCMVLPVTVNDEVMYTYTEAGKNCTLGKKYVEWEYKRLYALYFSEDRTYPASSVNLPEYSDEKNMENLKDVSQFYFLQSIDISDLTDTRTSGRKDIIVDDDYLQSLVTREAMTDDYLSHDRLIAEFSHTYNNRVNLSGMKRELFNGFSAASMFQFCDSVMPGWVPDNEKRITITIGTSASSRLDIYVYVKENGEVYRERASCQSVYLSYFLSDKRYSSSTDTQGTLSKMSWGCYVFYPNTNAFKMVITDFMGSYAIDLKAHDFLNGAYGVLDYELQRESNSTQIEVTNYGNIVDLPNKIYTSDVNNPFRFDVMNINTVGTGNILGISTAAKALSQGQFGQFPLYAFTTEGVWALEVSSTGTYSAKQPITRDVCITPDSITQIDSAVLFATDRGIMLISGSDSQCISDVLNTGDTFNPLSLPHGEELVSKAGFATGQMNYIPFLEFLKACGMLYDYTHQRIILYNPEVRYAYVYSLKDKAWGMMTSDISDGVNAYPQAYAMTTGSALVNFSEYDESSEGSVTEIPGIAFTRPLKLGSPDILKTVDTVIQRGHFRSDHVAQVLYGSRNLFDWHVIWSSKDKYLRGFRGTPYKYFRLALISRLDKNESLYGCSVQFTPRFTNRLR